MRYFFFRHPGSERSETPGQGGAEGDLFTQAAPNSGVRDSFALARAALSRGLRGCAACPGMTKGGALSSDELGDFFPELLHVLRDLDKR
jgi:hypothetical protein